MKIKAIANITFLLLGLLLFWKSLEMAGGGLLGQLFQTLSGWGFLYLAVYPLENLWNVMGWRIVFSQAAGLKVRFGKLYVIRLAGQALNNVTPFLDIGGEFLKVSLLKEAFGLENKQLAASVILSRSLVLFSEILFWGVGVITALFVFPFPMHWKGAVFVALFLAGAFCCALYWIEKNGLFSRVIFTVRNALRIPFSIFSKTSLFIRNVDKEIAAFYKVKGKFSFALLMHFTAWMVGSLEMWFIFTALGRPISFLESVVVEAMLHMLRTASGFIPGSIGAQEAGLAAIVQAMGYDPATGVAVSLLKRFRQIFWTGMGFGAWIYMSAIEKSLKKHLLDCDTPVDFLLHRLPAAFLSALLSKTPVTPNQVTLAALGAAAVSAVFFAMGNFTGGLLGLLFFYFWAVLDNTDGELARKTGRTSPLGKWLDEMCDTVGSALVLLGMFVGALSGLPPGAGLVPAALFLPALILNSYSGTKLSLTKQNLRRERLRANAVDRGFYFSQVKLDRLTGREPFYALGLFAIFVFLKGGAWTYVLLGTLVAGLYLFSFGYIVVERRLRARSGRCMAVLQWPPALAAPFSKVK